MISEAASAMEESGYQFYFSGDVVVISQYSGTDAHLVIPDHLAGHPVGKIARAAFRMHLGLISVTFPESVTEIGTDSFFSCTDLQTITIPMNVNTIGPGAFGGCAAMTGISVAPGNSYFSAVDGVLYNKNMTAIVQYPAGRSGPFILPDGIASLGPNALSYCYGLTSIAIPRNLTSIDRSAFVRCTSLADIIVDSRNENYSSVDGILYDKSASDLLLCPVGKEGAATLPDGVLAIETGAFQGCSSLTSVAMNAGLRSIMEGAFGCCTSLTNVVVPNNVTSIHPFAFQSCARLKAVTIGSNVSFIGECAFQGCYLLISITFLGLVAPVEVGPYWIPENNSQIRGYAPIDSSFPGPGGDFHGLIMDAPARSDGMAIYIIAGIVAAFVLLAMIVFTSRKRKR
jgi:hypothetical protein